MILNIKIILFLFQIMNISASRIILSGHRGGKFDYENTLSGYQLAIDNELDEIEFDIWLTKDKIPVIIHGREGAIGFDAPNGEFTKEAKINDLTLEQIKLIVLPNGEQIPTFEELLTLCGGKIKLNWEIKDEQPEVVNICIEMIYEKGLDYTTVNFSSFHHNLLKLIKEANSNFQCGYLYKSEEDMPSFDYYANIGDSCNIPINHLTEEVAENCNKTGQKIIIYFPKTHPESQDHYPNIIKYGVHNLISDNPLEFRKYVDTL
jgi:glycerophosphoryl diester phosphodiesterase